MNKKTFALLFSVFLIYAPIIYGHEQIRYAAVLYRHGDRTPVDPYPNDPWKNESLWPNKFGQLTNLGKTQQYQLGQWLRTRYTKLVPAYDPSEIKVRSSDVDRTLMSALTNLAGMYPPVANAIWNTLLEWQPIPVHTVPESSDEIIAMKKKCPTYETEKAQVITSEAYVKRLSQYQILMDYLSAYTGMNVKDYADINNIYSVLKIEKLYNFTLPDWTRTVFPDAMEEPAGYSFTVDTSTPSMARLKIGPFLKEVVNNMVKVMHHHNSMIPFHYVHYNDLDGVPPLKLHIYSGHDLTVASVLNGLRIFDGKCPEYTSAVLMELVYDEGSNIHFVKIFYRNTIEFDEPKNLLIPNCGYRCPLERFVKLYDNIIPANWDEECAEKLHLKHLRWLQFHNRGSRGLLDNLKLIWLNLATLVVWLYDGGVISVFGHVHIDPFLNSSAFALAVTAAISLVLFVFAYFGHLLNAVWSNRRWVLMEQQHRQEFGMRAIRDDVDDSV